MRAPHPSVGARESIRQGLEEMLLHNLQSLSILTNHLESSFHHPVIDMRSSGIRKGYWILVTGQERQSWSRNEGAFSFASEGLHYT